MSLGVVGRIGSKSVYTHGCFVLHATLQPDDGNDAMSTPGRLGRSNKEGFFIFAKDEWWSEQERDKSKPRKKSIGDLYRKNGEGPCIYSLA